MTGHRPSALPESPSRHIGLNQPALGSKALCRRLPGRSPYVTENANVYLWLGELAILLHHRPRRRGYSIVDAAIAATVRIPSKAEMADGRCNGRAHGFLMAAIFGVA